MRRIVTVLVLVPFALAFTVFALANRQAVVVSFDPFEPAQPAYTLTLPLFGLILALMIGGVLLGGIAAWLRQGKWRRAARLAQGEARDLRAEVDRLKRHAGEVPAAPPPAGYAARLTIPPPAR
jgi:uncharacterized integral membrane protein